MRHKPTEKMYALKVLSKMRMAKKKKGGYCTGIRHVYRLQRLCCLAAHWV